MDGMTRPEACEGRPVRKDKDATCRVVAKRLAWLAKDSNWDGTIRPTPKLLPPPSAGLKAACAGRRATTGGTSPFVEQAPGWDGQVTDTKCATPDKKVATTTRKARHDSSPHRDEYNRITGTPTRGSSKVAFHANQQDDVVAETPTVEKDNKHIDDTAASNKELREAEQTTGTRLSVRPFRGDDDDRPATHNCNFWRTEREEGEQEEGNHEVGALSFSDDEDTAAGNDGSNGASDRNGGVSGVAHGATSQESAVRGSTPRTDDTVSELSCSGIFTIPSAVDDEQVNNYQDQVTCSDESTHDSSSESSRVASPRDGDDIGASHVEHLIQERRRWKLRAFESEHELAGFQSLHGLSRVGRRDGGMATAPRSAEAIMLQASGSLSESTVSETSEVASGFDFDDRWQTASGNDEASSASPCSTPRVGGARRPRGVLDTVSDAQFSGAASASAPTSAASERLPARGTRCEAEGLVSDRHNRLVDGGDLCCGPGKDGDTREQTETEGTGDNDNHDLFYGDGEQCKDGARRIPAHQLLREEIAELKENLRKAELRHAAAEATAASVLQRARAAELSRDVKEIQIRNLEIRLARYTNTNKHHREACARWRERQHLGGDESAEDVGGAGIKLDLFRSRVEPLLPTVVEEGEEVAWPHERTGDGRGCPSSTVAVENSEPNDPVADARSEKTKFAVGGLTAGGRRAALSLDRFRQGCLVLGAKAARAGGGAMSVAAAVASEAAKEAVHSATTAVGRGGGPEAAGDRCSQGESDERIVEEFWGSDYCTSDAWHMMWAGAKKVGLFNK